MKPSLRSPLRILLLGGLLALGFVLASPGPAEAAPDGYWDLVRVELDKPPLEARGVRLVPDSRSGAFVVRAEFHNAQTGKRTDHWTGSWRWSPLPRALLAGQSIAVDFTQTITYQPKVDVGHQRSSSGIEFQGRGVNGWAGTGTLRSADGKSGHFHMSRWPQQLPQSLRLQGKAPGGREEGTFGIAVVIYHSGGLPPWVWRHVYEWRSGTPPTRMKDATAPPAEEWTRETANDAPPRDLPERDDPGTEPSDREEPRPERTATPAPDRPRASGMTLEAERRTVKTGGTVPVPVWLRNGRDLGNLNFEITYDPAVVRPMGKAIRGNLLGGAPFESNPAERGLVRIGFATSRGISGEGTVAQVRWEAVGRPGQRSPLRLRVTRADASSGGEVVVATIDGEIEILTEKGRIVGDSNGNGILDAGDALNALKMSVKLIPEDLVCDMDADRTVTSNDARLILKAATRRQ